MRMRSPAPRLLPLCIAAMAALLTMKSVALVRAVAAEAPAPAPAPAAAVTQAAAAPAVAAAPPAPAAAKTVAEVLPPDPQPDISAAERGLLIDLRHRRAELDARESGLAAREAVLGAAETRLGARVGELTRLQTRLETLEAARKDRDEANWRGLVKVYETMKPSQAAGIFNDLDHDVLLQVLDRMKELKAAPVLAAMLPDRARQATADLAQMRARANRLPSGG